ncbi:MAG: DUF4296 domain-containing protein [Ginsengibacter sp.]
MTRVLFFLLCCSLFSCADKNKTPSGIIRPKEMSGIMWDILRAQALAAEISRKDSSISIEAKTKVLTQKVFEIHNTTTSDFNKSYDWYLKNPGMLSIMFDSLYMQKQRENDLHKYDRYNPLKKDTLSQKIL